MRISDWSSDVCSSDLIGAFRFRAPIPKMRPVHICIIDLSVADCLGACRVNKIRVFMNVREILTLHAAQVMNDRDADVIEVPFFKDLTTYHAKLADFVAIGRAACRERGCKSV